MVWIVGLEREREKRVGAFLERETQDIRLMNNEGPTLSLGGRGVFIVTKKTPTPGLWIRHTVGKDPSFFHGVT